MLTKKKFLVRSKSGTLKWINSFRVRRFPRLAAGDSLKVTKGSRYVERVSAGDIPRGYDRLDKKWRKIAKRVASGHSVRDVCKKFGVDTDTFYRRRNAHPLFRQYLLRCYRAVTEDVNLRLNHQSHRATQIVDESMESEDPYFRYEVARDILKGRGKWAQKHETKTEIGGTLEVDISKEIGGDSGVTIDLVNTLVQGLITISRGRPIIDLKPEAVAVGTRLLTDGDTKVQESQTE